MDPAGSSDEADGQPLLAGSQAEPEGGVSLAGTAVPERCVSSTVGKNTTSGERSMRWILSRWDSSSAAVVS